MDAPLISVIIPTYNCGRYIEEAVESVLNQGCRELEIVVVDDGSTDDTGKRLGKYKDRIRLISQPNRGSSSARNAGLDHSRGQYVAFLDADDRWLPGKLERQLACFRELEEIGMVFSDFSAIGPDGILIAKSYLKGAFGVFREYGILLPDIFSNSRPIAGKPQGPGPADTRVFFGHVFRELCKGNFILPSTSIFRRSCIDAIGLRFNEAYRCAIDQDFHLRFALHHPVAYLDGATAEYRIGREGKLSGNLNTPQLILNTAETLQDIFRGNERLRAEHGELFRKVMGKNHARLAYYYLSVLDRGNARKHAAESLGYEPLRLKPAAVYALSFLPRFALDLLGRLKSIRLPAGGTCWTN